MKLSTRKIGLLFLILILTLFILIIILQAFQKGVPVTPEIRQRFILQDINRYYYWQKPKSNKDTRVIGKEVNSPKSLLEIVFKLPESLEKVTSSAQPKPESYIIVYNPDFSRQKRDWIAFVKAVDEKSVSQGYLTLWNNEEIERVKDVKSLTENRKNLQYYRYTIKSKDKD
jgi:hypothetical protein